MDVPFLPCGGASGQDRTLCPQRAPRVEALTGWGIDGNSPVTLLVSGTAGRTPRVYWKREPFGKDLRGETHCEEVDPGKIDAPEGLDPADGAMVISADFHKVGIDGNLSFSGQRVTVLIVDPISTQTSGASFVLQSGRQNLVASK